MIEVATLADEADVIALWHRAELTRPWNDPAADFALAVDGISSDILLTRSEGRLTGTAMAGFDGHRGWVYYLAVDPEHRRQGIGRMLMAAAEDWLRARGAPKLQLMVREDNAAALAFHEAMGLQRQSVVTLGRFLRED